jgi:hypothetical protein
MKTEKEINDRIAACKKRIAELKTESNPSINHFLDEADVEIELRFLKWVLDDEKKA